MSAVTALRADGRAPGYVVVEIEGRRYGSLPVERARSLGLAVGATLDEARLDGLARVAAEESALRAAVGALARRPRARADLNRWLLRRGHPRTAVQPALDRLATRGALDDASFARHFAAVRFRRGHGPSRLLRDLLALGVDRSIADEAIRGAQADESVDTMEEARRLAERRAGQLAKVPRPARRRRLLAYLARRGHDGAEVRRMVEELLTRP